MELILTGVSSVVSLYFTVIDMKMLTDSSLSSPEYPGYAPHSGTPADKENYTLFLRAIRDALDALEAETGKFYGLTAALPCGPDNIANIEVEYVKDLLTEL